jgi:putative membrane protein
VQVAIYWLMRPLLPNLSQRIDEGQTAPAVLLGAASLAGGLVNAACMSY